MLNRVKNKKNLKVSLVDFISYDKSVFEVLDKIGAGEILKKQKKILIKPNIVNTSPFPVTTSVTCCMAIIKYIRKNNKKAEIVIAEGSGDIDYETDEIFKLSGYNILKENYGVDLIDLNHQPLKKISNDKCSFFPTIYLPEIVFSSFIISTPVLKAHSLSQITGSLKNMVGIAPPKHYQGQYGVWKKAAFHKDIHQSVLDLHRYRSSDLTLVDASIGLVEHHLGGRFADPPVNKLVAGFNPVCVDRVCASLINLNWRKIPHLFYLNE